MTDNSVLPDAGDGATIDSAILTAALHLHDLTHDAAWGATAGEILDLRYAVVILLAVYTGRRPVTPAANRPAREGAAQ